MTSFINLLADDLWSEADIVNHTEAMLRSDWPEREEQILNRDFTAAMAGMAPMTPELQARAIAFKTCAEAARLAGVQARADMALLNAALAHEAAMRRLALEPVPDDEADAAERAAAQELISGAPGALLDLIALRNPPEDPQ